MISIKTAMFALFLGLIFIPTSVSAVGYETDFGDETDFSNRGEFLFSRSALWISSSTDSAINANSILAMLRSWRELFSGSNPSTQETKVGEEGIFRASPPPNVQ